MFQAQLLLVKDEEYSVFSPWSPRGGDYLIATLDVAAVNGAQVKMEVFTKNSEEESDGTNADSLVNITRSTVGPESAQWGGVLKELVRYKFTIAADETAGNWILFRVLPPVWFDAVTA